MGEAKEAGRSRRIVPSTCRSVGAGRKRGAKECVAGRRGLASQKSRSASSVQLIKRKASARRPRSRLVNCCASGRARRNAWQRKIKLNTGKRGWVAQGNL